MGTPDKKISELVEVVRSWIPRRAEPPNVSRDFWMPDQSCRVCYECDSQFTIFNRRHHCRICGRVFCAKCTANFIPAPSDEPKNGHEDWERIRVCNYCFKQWERGEATVDNGTPSPTPCLSPSPSATSLASTKSSCTCHSSSSTAGSVPYATGPYQRVPYSPHQSSQMDLIADDQENVTSGKSMNTGSTVGNLASNQYGYCFNRSDDEDDGYGGYHSDTESRHFSHVNDYDDHVNIHGIDHVYGPLEVHHYRDNTETQSLSSLMPAENLDLEGVHGIQAPVKEPDENDHVDRCDTSQYIEESTNSEPVDFENNGPLWLPPEPEDKEDEREAVLFDDDDDEGATGEWGYLRPSTSFGSGEYCGRDKTSEEHRKAMKNVVEGHFRALVAQLLQVESLAVCDEDQKESWLDIITALSWEAATLLKPDMSKGGGMDPGGYVKVKCIACGRRCESKVIKGVVCKKNVAHRRMTSKYDKPRFLILGGALEYQRVSNQLSSVDTLLQQEMDHLKMAVAKIGSHYPNVLLVEKSVSRYAQEYLLAKDISLVLNVKRPLLERIARCTGAQIVPSIDHMNPQKLGTCETFHVDKYFEEHGSAGQSGKKLTKTLMFFEGCPRPLGCTILLKGANGDELKKVKHVVQYGVFAAYHLALETSFLADEGASLPELPLKSPITVALPDKPSSVERSISTVPGFLVVSAREHQGSEPIKELLKSNDGHKKERNPSCRIDSIDESLVGSLTRMQALSRDFIPSGLDMSSSHNKNFLPSNGSKEDDKKSPKEFFQCTQDVRRESVLNNDLISDSFYTLEPSGQVGSAGHTVFSANHRECLELHHVKYENNNIQDDIMNSKEDFPPSTSDHQSILVFLSTRCVWKGTVCERSHLVRIKYYGSSDKPLGRFLRDQLFDQSYCCHSCEMSSEAHVHCYTHRQGSLTISVKKLPKVLPGEREGKIWMWHRCLKCRRVNGFPPATRRIVMSDAAWGLSFGKFLELSFSNHAAASRVASCGHSLHRDCLRFYGFGEMVACFHYASIDLHSVYLPPPKLEFNYDNQDWLQKEEDEVHNRANMLFAEVGKALNQMSDKFAGFVPQEGGNKASDFRHLISELEGMLQKEREEFGELLRKVLNREVKVGHSVVDILELNKLRRQIMIHSYVWDQRLIYASNQSKIILKESRNLLPNVKEKPIGSREKVVEVNATSRPGRGHGSCDSFLLEANPDGSLTQGTTDLSQPGEVQKCEDKDLNTSHGKVDLSRHDGANIGDKYESLEFGGAVQGAQSEGDSPIMANLSDTLDAAWTGEGHPTNLTRKENNYVSPDSSVTDPPPMGDLVAAKSDFESYAGNMGGDEMGSKHDSKLHLKGLDTRWSGMPFPNLFSSFNKTSSLNTQKLGEYNPVYILSFRELERQTGARLLPPAGINDVVVPVYDDEPTSAIAYVLMSLDYHVQMAESERAKDSGDCLVSLPLFDSTSLLSLSSFDETITNTYRNFGSSDESISSSSVPRSSQAGDPHLDTKDLHARVSFTHDSCLGKVKYTVTCYFAKRFEALRRICCPSELDFVRSLSRCKKWGAQGGKSNVFFAKTLDDRFIIKQVTKTELESFIKFAPAYFQYLSESVSPGSPTCLAKILGIYQVTSKHLKGGKETKMDVLVMENLLFRRNIRLLYDLKGSSRSRYNPDTSGSNKVLLDQNLIEAMPTSPIFVGNKAKRLLERAVWNDTAFLASIYVMDYSLLVGVDEEKHELVLGIIDFMRQYTWDKHLETWVKTSGILGGPKNTAPTVISPQQYKKRFRKAMSAYFLMVPDQWSPPMLHPSGSQSDLCDEHS